MTRKHLQQLQVGRLYGQIYSISAKNYILMNWNKILKELFDFLMQKDFEKLVSLYFGRIPEKILILVIRNKILKG